MFLQKTKAKKVNIKEFRMKKIVGILLLICLVFVGCDLGSGDDDETFVLSDLRIRNTDVKSLYVSNVSVSSSRAVNNISTIQTLSYISEGQNTPFAFTTPSGKNIVLEVSNLRQLDDKRIEVSFSSYYEISSNSNTIGDSVRTSNNMKALIDFEKNKVYDFTDWDIRVVKNNIVVAGGRDYTIYKINLDNPSTAIPLNNRYYYPINNVLPMLFEKKIISRDPYYYVVDINNDVPITPLKEGSLTNDMCSFITAGNPLPVNFWGISSMTGLLLEDLSGDNWFFATGGKAGNNNGLTFTNFWNRNTYFFGKISIDDNGQVVLTDFYDGTFSFTPAGIHTLYSTNGKRLEHYNNYLLASVRPDLLFLFNNGFIRITKNASGFQVESTTLSIPTDIRDIRFIKDNYLYYFENSAIKRFHLSVGSLAEVVYSNSRLLTEYTAYFSFTGNNIIFYQFDEDNISVNTYSLAMYQPGATPQLLSRSQVEIRNIVELDF
jgi:hypothetical protein